MGVETQFLAGRSKLNNCTGVEESMLTGSRVINNFPREPIWRRNAALARYSIRRTLYGGWGCTVTVPSTAAWRGSVAGWTLETGAGEQVGNIGRHLIKHRSHGMGSHSAYSTAATLEMMLPCVGCGALYVRHPTLTAFGLHSGTAIADHEYPRTQKCGA